MTIANQTPSRHEVWKVFDRIAPRYDFLNHLLSGGLDRTWRSRVAQLLPKQGDLYLLDLATGTGDLVLALGQNCKNIKKAIGLDLASNMLETASQKISRLNLESRISLQQGDATQIPFPETIFDVVTMGFGIRNVCDVSQTLQEIYRVLKPGGQIYILEFSLPKNPLIRILYQLYLRHVLPWIAGFVSGSQDAYHYLSQTIETFPYGPKFCDLLSAENFKEIRAKPLTFGIVTIYQGKK